MQPSYSRNDTFSSFAQFGETCDSAGTVYVRQDASLMDQKWQEPTINWSCVGQTSVETAQRFVERMSAAIAYSKQPLFMDRVGTVAQLPAKVE